MNRLNKQKTSSINAFALASTVILIGIATGPAQVQGQGEIAPFVGGTATITHGNNWFKFVDPAAVSDRDGSFRFEGISDDGTTVFGLGRFNGDEMSKIVWDHTQGNFADAAVILPAESGGAISADGNTFYSSNISDSDGDGFFRWTRGQGSTELPRPDGADWFQPRDTTPDGRYVVGQASFGSDSSGFPTVFRHQGAVYDTQTQQYTLLGDQNTTNTAVAISDDGSVVLGSATNPVSGQQRQAFRYTADTGIEFLTDPVSGEPLRDPKGMSADGGRMLVGREMLDRDSGFIELPPFIIPDMTNDPDRVSRFRMPQDVGGFTISGDGTWVGMGDGDDSPGGIWNESLGSLFFYEFLELAGLDVLATVQSVEPKWPLTANAFTGITLNGDILTLTGRIGADQGFGGFVAQIDVTTLPGIPEPATVFLLGIGGVAMLVRPRRAAHRHKEKTFSN